MGGTINLPTRKEGSIVVVSIPPLIFGKRITIQAHDIKKIVRCRDICDGHECDQTEAVGDVKFFTARINITNI